MRPPSTTSRPAASTAIPTSPPAALGHWSVELTCAPEPKHSPSSQRQPSAANSSFAAWHAPHVYIDACARAK